MARLPQPPASRSRTVPSMGGAGAVGGLVVVCGRDRADSAGDWQFWAGCDAKILFAGKKFQL